MRKRKDVATVVPRKCLWAKLILLPWLMYVRVFLRDTEVRLVV
jgi:hypothetical protein